MGCKLCPDRRRYKVRLEEASRRDATVTSDGAGSGNGTRDDTVAVTVTDVATGTMMERTLVALFIVLLIIMSIPG